MIAFNSVVPIDMDTYMTKTKALGPRQIGQALSIWTRFKRDDQGFPVIQVSVTSVHKN